MQAPAPTRLIEGGLCCGGDALEPDPVLLQGPAKPSARGAGDGFNLTTLSARVEPFTGPSTQDGGALQGASRYRDSFKRRRCIVPCTAWREWKEEEGRRCKHRFARADGKPIWFAGLWDSCTTDDEGEFKSFTIMTGRQRDTWPSTTTGAADP